MMRGLIVSISNMYFDYSITYSTQPSPLVKARCSIIVIGLSSFKRYFPKSKQRIVNSTKLISFTADEENILNVQFLERKSLKIWCE